MEALAEVAAEAQEAVAGTASKALFRPQLNCLDQLSLLIISHF